MQLLVLERICLNLYFHLAVCRPPSPLLHGFKREFISARGAPIILKNAQKRYMLLHPDAPFMLGQVRTSRNPAQGAPTAVHAIDHDRWTDMNVVITALALSKFMLLRHFLVTVCGTGSHGTSEGNVPSFRNPSGNLPRSHYLPLRVILWPITRILIDLLLRCPFAIR